MPGPPAWRGPWPDRPADPGPGGYTEWTAPRAILHEVEAQQIPSEEFPAMYRTILDGILQLEQQGHRREAALIRAEATGTYSGAWDERGRRHLQHIQRRIERVVAGEERPRTGPARLPAMTRILAGQR